MSYGRDDYAEYYDYLADGTKVRHAYQDGQERFYAGYSDTFKRHTSVLHPILDNNWNTK